MVVGETLSLNHILAVGQTFTSYTPTIVVKNNETNDKFYRKVAFPRYTESVKFMSQSRETASKLKPHRGLGTRLPSP